MPVPWPRLRDALAGLAATVGSALLLVGDASAHPAPLGPVSAVVAPAPQVIADGVIARHLEAQR